MRTIRTFVLRLLVDPAKPRTPRGSIQAISEPQSHPFADEPALLALLYQMISQTSEPGEERPIKACASKNQ